MSYQLVGSVCMYNLSLQCVPPFQRFYIPNTVPYRGRLSRGQEGEQRLRHPLLLRSSRRRIISQAEPGRRVFYEAEKVSGPVRTRELNVRGQT